MTRANPPYNYALGASNQEGAPPFDLSNVVMRIFPLRANYHSLQLFCDRFINIAPEYSHCEPSAPFVLFCVINYGHMGNVASNLGYTSQNEVLFSVPLNWYRKKSGKWELQPRASISPFIWVDEPGSAWTGRNVFGWPKSIAWLTPGLNEWSKDPTAARTMFALSALTYERMFAGQRQEPSLLLEIEQEQPASLFKMPPDLMNPLNPWTAWPKGVLRSLSMGGTLLETMTRLPTFGFPPWGQGSNILQMMASTFGDYSPINSLPASNTINLKQFREPSHPQSISYQAITNSQMTTKSFSRGGMLGEPGLLSGDLAGGYRIRMHRNPAWPIIESLGLEVSEERTKGAQNIATLEPVFPFWVDVDFEYGAGEVICWRTYESHWAPSPSKQAGIRTTPLAERVLDEFQCEPCGSPHLYNTAEGSAVEQVYGPFRFPNATVRVLPLMADWDRLRKFTDSYLNFPDGDGQTLVDTDGNLKVWPEVEDGHPEQYKQGMPCTPKTGSGNLFVPWGRYVYMTVTKYEEITSALNVGWWAKTRVTFSYPVKWYEWTEQVDGKEVEPFWALKSFGVVSPFMYVDTPTAATVGREMNGWCVTEADIKCPPNDWLRGGVARGADLMTLTTEVMPALNANQKVQSELLVEVTTRDPVDAKDEEAWREIAAVWGERFVEETQAKANEAWRDTAKHAHNAQVWDPRQRLKWLKSTAMEVLFRGLPINHIALKQFRDAEDPNDACLQAINVYPESIERVHDLRPINEPLYVAVHRYPTQPIVALLGLDVKWTDASGGQPVQYLEAIRPFSMRADLTADLGSDVALRAGSAKWRPGDEKSLYFDSSDAPASPALASEFADNEPGWAQDFGTDRFFEESKKRSQDMFGQSEWSFTRGGHRALLREARVSFAPQTAIESILRHNWVNFGPDGEDLKLDDPAIWYTLIPKSSIRHDKAETQFLKDFGPEHLQTVAADERADDQAQDGEPAGEVDAGDDLDDKPRPLMTTTEEAKKEEARRARPYWVVRPKGGDGDQG